MRRGHGGKLACYKTLFSSPGSRWRVRDLTYRITKYPRGLLKNDVDREIARAFKVSQEREKYTKRLLYGNERQL